MSQDAGIDIDYDSDQVNFDQELAAMQRQSAAQEQAEADGEETLAGEVVDDGRAVEFMGRKFRVADKLGAMPLLKFSRYADVSTADPRAMGAMYAMLRDCIHPGHEACGKCEACKDGREAACKDYDPGDWAAFEEHAMDTRADADELLEVITKVIELISGRPTGQPSASSGGRRAISAGSTARSSGRRGKGSRR